MGRTPGNERRSSRKAVNQNIVRNGKYRIYTELRNIDARCNEQIGTARAGGDIGFMECKAVVSDYLGLNEIGTGKYKAAQSTHAEMNALAKLRNKSPRVLKDYIGIIDISAPPCKQCAFVLELLGLIDKVYTTKNIYKTSPGGSWHWPENLRDVELFDADRWAKIKRQFKDSNLSDDEILRVVVDVVTKDSAN